MINLKKIDSLWLTLVVLSLNFFLSQSAAAQVTVPAIVFVRTNITDDPAYTGKTYQMAIWSNVASAAKPITVIRSKAGIETTLATITSVDLVTPAIIPVTFPEPGIYTIVARHADVSDVNAITDRTVVAGVVITLTSNSPTQVGASASFTATVEQYGAPATSGVITFTEGATTLAVVTVDGSGVATWSTSALTADEYSINATYDDGSTATVLHTVTPLDICFATPNNGVTLYRSSDGQAVQQAVDAAAAGDTIKIAGTCAGVDEIDGTTQSVYINKTVTLSGGYTTTNWLTSDSAANPTTLDAEANGRVIYAIEPLTVENVIIQNGLVADGDGGGLYVFGDLTINDSLIRDNVATGAGFDSYGGGVSALGLVNVSGSTFSNNLADYDGGGLYVMGMLTITDTTFLSNTAGARGGGLHIYGNIGVLETEYDPSSLTGVTFQNNSAGAGGGGAYLRNGAEMTGLAFFDNRAATGGALFFAGITTTPIEVSNSRFGRNRATTNQGDVIYFFDEYPGQVDLLHNTLVNSAPTGGSALYLNMGSLNLTNTIVASHTVAILNSGGAVTEDYNLFYGNDTNLSGAVSSGGHSLVGDPAFVDPTNDDYDLSATSNALDRGTDAGLAEDWAGDPRPQGNGFDIGADEAPYTAPYLCFATLDGSTIYESFTAQALQDALAAASAGDTVRIAGDCQGSLPLVITMPITLSGGYTTGNWLTPDLTTYPTTLDGDGSTRVLSITGEIAVTLQGLTLQNGDAGTENGGCLYIDLSTVTLNDTIITGCQAEDGGGVRVGSTLILNAGTVISGNTATGNGGGILVNGTPTATVVIQGGEVLSNTAVNGGGIAVLGSGNILTMTSGAISYNVAQGVDSADDTGGDGLGGGIYNTGAAWLTGGVLQTNRAEGGRGGSLGSDGGATGGNGRGGAIYNDGVASLTVTNVTLAANEALGGAGYSTVFNTGGDGGDAWGGAIDNNGALTLSDTELRNNLAQGGNGGRGRFDGGYGGVGLGGALALWGSDPLILNNVQLLTNTVQGGDGDDGADFGGDGGSSNGGALFSEPPLTMTNSHFQNNGAVAGAAGEADGGSDGNVGLSEGGAIYAAETLVITATSFFANSADHGGAIYQFNSDFTLDQRIVNSLFAHNAAWLSSTGAAIHYNDEGAVELLHNTISAAGAGTPTGVAALWFDQAASVAITNTIIVAHDVGMANNDGALTVTGAGNLFFGNNTADTVGNVAAGFALPSGDPAFVDAANDDYRLTNNSAAIERGVTASILDDFAGALRPQGIAPDAGAFESAYTARCFATADSGATVHLSPDSMAVRSAIADAVTLPSSEVRVAGTCEGVTTASGTTQLALVSKSLTLRGGYTTTNWLTSDPSANPTTLNALRSGRVIYTSQPLTVENLIVQNGQATNGRGGAIYAGSTLRLVNSTISNSAVTGSSPNGLGGGAWVSGVATLNGADFISNTATVNGGGAYLNGAATVSGSAFYSNTAGTSGGGAYLNATGTIATTTFQGNQSSSNAGGGLYAWTMATLTATDFIDNQASAHSGGGLYGLNNVTVATTTFVNNRAGINGGGARVLGTATLTGVTFTNNTAKEDGGGAAINGATTIVNSSFLNNTATTGRGGGAHSIGVTTVQTSTFQSNQAAQLSGGALNLDNRTTIVSSTFLSNTALIHSGGAIYSTDALSVTATTFQNNRANANGGGVRTFANVTFVDSQFRNNQATTGSGGGLYVTGAATISATTFTGNSAYTQGGGGYVSETATISGASFSNNRTVTDSGGAVSAAAATISTTSWSNNQAQKGGGALYLRGGVSSATRLFNNWFARNQAINQKGSAIALGGGNSAYPAALFYNTIANPTLGSGSAIYVYSGTVGITNTIITNHAVAIEQKSGAASENYNLFFGNSRNLSGTVSSGGQSRIGDPLFVDDASDDYALGSNSAALHFAADVGVYTDFAGDPRPQGTGADVGAFESAESAHCFASPNSGATVYASTDSSAVRAAIAQAVALPSSEVRLAGTCEGVATSGGTTQLALITQTLTLRGGYTITGWLASDPAANPTMLDALNSGRVLYTTQPLTVENLIVQNGLASSADGGGIYAGSDLWLIGAQIQDNAATGSYPLGDGGGVFVSGSTSITGSSFSGNASSLEGGGAYVAGLAHVTDASFTHNFSSGGGGIIVRGATAYITNSTFISNSAYVYGGGASLYGAGYVTGTTFLSNTVTQHGGGLSVLGVAYVTATNFLSNSALYGGGAYWGNSATVTDALFRGNRATYRGGGTYGANVVTMVRNTFRDNQAATNGGGLFVDGSTMMTGTSFFGNTAQQDGGGALYLWR